MLACPFLPSSLLPRTLPTPSSCFPSLALNSVLPIQCSALDSPSSSVVQNVPGGNLGQHLGLHLISSPQRAQSCSACCPVSGNSYLCVLFNLLYLFMGESYDWSVLFHLSPKQRLKFFKIYEIGFSLLKTMKQANISNNLTLTHSPSTNFVKL